MSKKWNVSSRKSQDSKCHLGLSLVKDCTQNWPFGDGHYYHGFEFCSEAEARVLLNSMQDADPCAPYQIYWTYLEPYFQMPNIYSDTINGKFDTDRFLQEKCDNCGNAAFCAVKDSFLKSLRLTLRMRYDACCTDREINGECIGCRKWYTISELERSKKIRVYDLRLLGHPVKIFIHYAYVRCIPRTRCLISLAGIDSRSGSNPVRFSYRLAQRINAALAENLRKTYIAEACAVPERTIYSWKCQELKRSATVHATTSVSTNFLAYQPISAMHMPGVIHRRNFVFVIHKTAEITTLQSVYTKAEWNFMESIASGKPCKIPILTNSQILNLAYDYLSCCTNIAPRVGAVILANIWCLLLSPDCRTDPLTDVLQHDRELEVSEDAQRILNFSQTTWSEFEALLPTAPRSALRLLSRVFRCLQAETDNTSEAETLIPGFSTWFREYASQDVPNTIFSASPVLSDQLEELFMIADLSPLSWHESIARLLHFNPVALPHKGSALSALDQYLFTEDGFFAADHYNQVPIEELFRMVQAGLMEDDVSIPISDQVWPERFERRMG